MRAVTQRKVLYEDWMSLFRSGLIVVWCAGIFLFAGCEVAPEPVANTTGSSPAPRAVTVPFHRPTAAGDHIAIPVSLDGGPVRSFIVDTGAPVTSIMVSKE